jgi:hypothetical protein
MVKICGEKGHSDDIATKRHSGDTTTIILST